LIIHNLRLAAVLAVTAITAASTPAVAASYDAVADFSTVSSTGLWSYGFGITGSSFTAATVGGGCGPDIFCWQPDSTSLGTPLIGLNTTAGNLLFPTGWIPNDMLDLHPGQTGAEDAIVRFTAPTAGTYSFNGMFGTIGYDATGVLALGYGPAGLLFSGSLPSASPGVGQFGSTFAFAGTVALAAGDVVDFGVNNAGLFFGDSTMMSLTVSNVPEPASWAMLIAGFGLTGAAMRRRRLVAA
jgi:hypothetical protein